MFSCNSTRLCASVVLEGPVLQDAGDATASQDSLLGRRAVWRILEMFVIHSFVPFPVLTYFDRAIG